MLNNLLIHLENGTVSEWQTESNPRIKHIRNLLTSLQNHLLANYSLAPKARLKEVEEDILVKHVRDLFSLATEAFSKVNAILEKYPSSLDLLFNILFDSFAGAMLLKVLSSLLLLPSSLIRHTLVHLLGVLEPLSVLNNYLPSAVQDEESNQSGKYRYRTLQVLIPNYYEGPIYVVIFH